MTKINSSNSPSKGRAKQELSPELSEVLHMLKALEGQKNRTASAQ